LAGKNISKVTLFCVGWDVKLLLKAAGHFW